MKSIHRRLTATLAAWALGGWATAQFTFTPSFQNYQTFSQRTYGYVAATVQPVFVTQAVKQATRPTSAPSSYRHALSGTDLRFSGQPSQQRNCAVMATRPADQRQMAELCLQLFRKLEAQPGFRKHNLAMAVGLLIGVSLQASRGTELDDTHSDILIRSLNDQLIEGGAMKAKPADVQASYESALMTTALIATLAQQGESSGDAQLSAAARAMSEAVLTGFGVRP